jgi:hypothetical protein
MILEEATFEAFGYEVWELTHRSNKPLLAACELCGEFRITTKNAYHSFCKSCAKTDKNHPNYGKRGSETSHYKGGLSVTNLKKNICSYIKKQQKEKIVLKKQWQSGNANSDIFS